MGQAVYTEENLLAMGRSNYEKLLAYCTNLERSGFWEQAGQVMKQSSAEVLDRYVQSVLMKLAIHCGQLLENQKEYISLITDTNPMGIARDQEIDPRTLEEGVRYSGFPPVLLQLCGVYDRNFGKDTGEYFLDSFLNILLCMAYLNDGRDQRVSEFIREYYQKVCPFLDESSSWNHTKYLYHKLHVGGISCDVRWLHVSDGEEQAAQVLAEPGREMEPPLTPEKSGAEETDPSPEKSKVEETTPALGKSVQDLEESEEERARREQEETELAREQFQLVKKRLQDREEAERHAREKRLRELLDELEALVGLQGVKEEIRSLVNLIKIRKLREEMQMPTMDMTYHMVFTGAPGTGKTTVARLVSRIYQELGILSKGTMIETDRSGLVAGYVGQTAIKVHDLVEQAMGGVLFIDEAYSLVNPEVPNDFGMEAVDTLVKLMEDHRDDLVVIVAGYTQEMKDFLKCNTGMVSRFNKFIDFPDYTIAEMLDIMNVMAKEAGLFLEDAAREAVGNRLRQMGQRELEEFGNARGIRNMFEKIVMNQANRLILLKKPTREELMTIVQKDVIAV